jgi:threonyl-tRNA synthetase
MRPVSKAEALAIYKDNEYKTELISNLEDGTITFCDHSTF